MVSPKKKAQRSDPRSHSPEKSSFILKIKMPSSKLRQAISSDTQTPSAKSRKGIDDGAIITGPRSNRTKAKYVVESESEQDEVEEEEDDDEGEDEDEDDDDEDDAGVADEELLGEEDEDEDAEGEDDDTAADGDVDMEDASPLPPPTILKTLGSKSAPIMVVTPATNSKLKTVETREMELEDDEEDLSDLDSDAEGDDEEEEGSPASGSRGSTPDVSKMTKRQRARLDQVMGEDFLQLPMEPQIKKHLTAEEHAMRRAEMARRRKNLSEKRNEEEKMDTINRLLKKQAPKRRGKISQAEIQEGTDKEEVEEEAEPEKANPVYVRWVNNANGSRLGVPEEWLGGPAGRVFEGRSSGKLIEEVT